jgi:hypothetical protein
LAANRSDSEEFVDIVLAMLNRSSRGNWDFQEITNRPVIERLRRDTHAVQLLKDKLSSNATVSERATLPRYITAAGVMDVSIRDLCESLLKEEAKQPLLRAGYDAVEDAIRAVSLSLLDAAVPSFSR